MTRTSINNELANSNLCKRIIPCLDVADGRTVKGIKFAGLRDVGNPIEQALLYQKQGADEIMFLDILSSSSGKRSIVSLVAKIADQLSIPFTVGGGIGNLDDAKALLENGADKISINSAAVANPNLITEIANVYGSQCCVIAIDAKRFNQTAHSWEVLTHGGRQSTNFDALNWAKQAINLGAGEILLTSWDKDGTLSGFDLNMVQQFSSSLSVPVIASGGAKGPQCFADVFEIGEADAALAATIFHDSIWSVKEIKEYLNKKGVSVRLC